LDSLIHGEGLESLMKKRKLTFVDKINILFQVARGIAELHAVGKSISPLLNKYLILILNERYCACGY
jgi:hypothetical protein